MTDPINNVTTGSVQPTGTPLSKPGSGTPATDVNATTTGTTGTTESAGANAAAATTSSSSSVTTLSAFSQLQAAQAASSTDAVFSTSKVNEIKQAIAEGRFQVNSEKVADGLLQGVVTLLGTRQRG